MKKIGVITLFGDYNMGNKLQTYAVMQLYRSLGHDVAAVNHVEWELVPNKTFSRRIRWIFKSIFVRIFPKFHPNLRRRRIFLEFSENYLIPAETVSIRHIPPELKARYNFFSVGSDQVWHNWTGNPEELDFFFLKFADRRQRLCLSPSFGLESVPEEQTTTYREGLNGFLRLSCREESGVKLIHDLTGRDAALLLDPTMCLSAAEWERLERKPAYPLPEGYVLSYILSSIPRETRDAVSRYSRLLNADVVTINNADNKTEYYAATGPQEFLYLIRHASLVCTNSFHGTVFSILFHKNFVCFNRGNASAKGDMSNRITTLLDKFHLSTRRHGVLADEDLLSTDYAGAEETLSRERERVLDYLREALADNGEE